MRILYLVPYVPNLIRVRPYNLICSLVALGHKVTVLTLASNEADWADVEALRSVCEVSAETLPKSQSIINCLKVLPTKQPLQSAYCWQQKLADRAVSYLKTGDFDVLHVEHLRGIKFGLYCKQLAASVPVIWDSVDCISYLFEQAVRKNQNKISQLMTRLDLARTKRFERDIVAQLDRTIVTSRLDKQAFETLAGDNAKPEQINVIANGVDLEYFNVGQAERHPAQLVMTGKMSYHANEAMATYMVGEIMPRIWAHHPDTNLMIVGKDPSASVVKLAEHPCVTVTGMVADIRPYLHQSTIAVAPIRYGAGIQNKVLEAMACGAPAVVTPQAVAALDRSEEEAFLVGRDSAEISQQIINLLNNPARQHAISQAARRFVEQNHNWQTAASKLTDVYEQVC